MKNFIFYLTILFLLFSCTTIGSIYSLSDRDDVKFNKISDYYVGVNTYVWDLQNNTTGIGWSSGFIIDPSKGYIMTCNHSVSGGLYTTVLIVDVIYKNKAYSAKIIAVDRVNDIALLKIDLAVGLKKMNFAKKRELRKGLSAYSVSRPRGKYPNFYRKSTLAGHSEKDVFIDSPVVPGESGSILMQNGKIIGMIKAVSRIGGLSWATASWVLEEFYLTNTGGTYVIMEVEK